MTDDPNKVPDAPVTASPASADAPPANGADKLGADKPSALPEGELARLTDEIIAALKTVYDPEIPSDIYELGLIYKIDIADDRDGGGRHDAHHAELPLGAGAADHGGERRGERARRRPGQGQYRVGSAWDPSRMSDEARAVLNMW